MRDALPATAHGVRVAGDPGRVVRRVAVLGGSGGDELADAAATGADVIVTSDLKHHVALDLLAAGGTGVGRRRALRVGVAVGAARRITAPHATSASGGVEVLVSTLVTDPWTFRA